MKATLRVFGLLVLAIGFCLSVAWYFLEQEIETSLNRSLDIRSPYMFTIDPGDNARGIGRLFEREGWVTDARLFVLHARMTGDASRMQAGTYIADSGDTLKTLITRIVNGDTATFTIGFVEGTRFSDMLASLAANDQLVHTLEGMTERQILDLLEIPRDSGEGLFFPAVYRFAAQTSDRQILMRAYQRMQQELEQAWAQRSENLPLKTPYEALILASIIEKETGAAEERREIAGVFARRLVKGMKLQTDPTVIYGLGAAFDGNLTRAHLRADTPYNTYTRFGLPPGPIALPGRAALLAAVNPAPGDALYFVSRGDGHHYFSKTLSEHNRAVRKYQLKR